MRSFVPVPNAPVLGPSIFDKAANAIKRGIDAMLNQVFSLTHAASLLRWNVVVVGFILAWLLSLILTVPQEVARQQIWEVFIAFGQVPADGGQSLTLSFLKLMFAIVFHPVVIKHALALVAPFWLMHRVAAIYLADVFEESDLAVARHFVMEAAFGRGYRTLNIKQGAVNEEDAKSSTIIKIGGPGYVQTDLDSAALFERPDGTPHVILPGRKEIIDDFERLRRVIDTRDSVETIDLPATRTKDGIFVGAKTIQFSYSVYRGENPDRSKTPYPCSASAVENLVYKDGRSVRPGIAPARVPEWRLGQFKMGGAITGEISTFISKRSLSDFLAATGEPEENLLLNREKEIIQISDTFGSSGAAQPTKSPLEPPKNFSPRTELTEIFYSQDDFVKRMTQKGFQLNWIGVGTWHTPTEIIPANHREAWRISRENLAHGSKAALQSVENESTLQELLRLIQTPVTQYLKGLDLLAAGDEKPLDDMLLEYEEVFNQALDLCVRGSDSLQARFVRLITRIEQLLKPSARNPYDYNEFLNYLNDLAANGYSIGDPVIEEILQRSAALYESMQSVLGEDDLQFLLDANKLYEDSRNCKQIERVRNAVHSVRRSHWV